MGQILYQLDDNSLTFPLIECALTEPNGLLALGGDLSPERLIAAYSQGIFPWYSDNDPLMWWSPNPRAIIDIDQLRINRTLRKAINKSPYQITLNQDFSQVTQLCANAPFRTDGTWILPEMEAAYLTLHQQGYAHSIEVWYTDEHDNKALVGGLYGVAVNGFFSGESMFYKQSNASKFALIALGQLLKSVDINFIDCQLLNPFLEDMGAKETSRDIFIHKQQHALTKTMPDDFWQPRTLTVI
ncbi:leucyl/phenylalanyl-tRNA--protein transferase [Colwellia psychrerythraea 34H]|uniref:Leucyl/phenylalanyl-tRNA--protein transferase n=1 Tax=Colwellia psychrerythraea (strain 34H / ATCC BAA-681) TaxID=167879 RepID=LFTR_COLP3|nr:leucyl/phenylalanyl-tRNA--protein transferase [Colwellia psychrerythraea]Q480P4.1 RecName: Full=Leucyl/phenylalanyl-tRNA--protein transferase; AltName: Full=L/F-transferase; AltName: Full=Leucyltransferase; AltName: Full=Phenyalanyltransferase [Colwellia psychrerythraea 34H]AAZ26753.1 leucyl/phenylalanyl-tRNA--protein transferase [Colwellia psychrerythraea 34H]